MASKDYRLDWIILWILIGVEALLFYTFYTREIAPYPPQNFDQAVYLTETYALETRAHENGLGELWKELCSRNHPSSLLFTIEGALSGLIFGGTRLPQLGV